MKTYHGRRTGFDGAGFHGVTVNGHGLRPRVDLRNHSPTGYNWGYGGSGPAQLALAILCDHLGDDDAAQKLYQPFKWHVIAKLPQETPWTLTSNDIDRALAEIRAESPLVHQIPEQRT